MRQGLCYLVGVCGLALLPSISPSQPSAVPVQPGEGPIVSPITGAVEEPWRFWVRGEFLSYWVRNAPLPISILTGDPANPTQELLNSSQSFGLMPGYRISTGVAFDAEHTVGLDMNYFTLQRRSRSFNANSDEFGNPTLVQPYFDQTPGAVGNAFAFVAFPGVFTGGVSVTSSLQLMGTEGNIGAILLPRQVGLECTVLAGFRYVALQEDLNISTLSNAFLTAPPSVLFQSDQFNTRNQFYGGQIGARLNWTSDLFAIDVIGKLALGCTQQSADIQGYTSQTGAIPPTGVFPGGFYAQPSNIGRYYGSQFSMIPAVEVKLHVFVTQRCTLFAGYDLMYWTNVVRPGNQIDPNINRSQNAVIGGGALLGPALPAPQFNRSDFWAQGFNVGFELKF